MPGGNFIWRHICCFYQLVTVYSIVTCNKMATWGWGWLPGVPLCLPVRRSLSLSQLIKKNPEVGLLWLEQDYFLLINGVWNCFSLAARLIFFFSVSWQTQQFCGNSWYTRHYKIAIWCWLVYCTAFDWTVICHLITLWKEN